MNTRRLGLATAAVALSALSACSTWHGMTDRITGRSTSSDTARGTRTPPSQGTSGGTWSRGAPSETVGATGASSSGGAAMSAGTMPGIDTAGMRGPTLPATAGRGTPVFRSYNECRTWLSQQGRALNRGPTAGGEVSMADTDPCRDQPRS